jgi:cell division protein FtsZ
MTPLDSNIISARPLRIKIIGLGGAGASVIEHMAATDAENFELTAIHTNSRVLHNRSIPTKLLLGVNRTHGLGTGGDPELARVMAESEYEELRALCKETDLLFIIAGLGGGTGTGIAPVLAKAGKDSGALVLAVVTSPFEFEGTRRVKQAIAGLHLLKAAADAVICLPNQKICRIIDDKSTVVQAFASTNRLMAEGIRGICQMLTRPGLMNVDFAHLYSILRGRHLESAFATASATGENRVQEVVENLANTPLMDSGQALCEAETILVSIVGGPDLAIADVNSLMEQITRRTDTENIIMGAAIEESSLGKITVTLVAAKANKNSTAVAETGMEIARAITPAGEIDTNFFEKAPTARGNSRFKAPPPASTPENTQQLLQSSSTRTRKAAKLKQATFDLEIISRGRFEKSEPTIHHGADLDVPTYIRRGVPLN